MSYLKALSTHGQIDKLTLTWRMQLLINQQSLVQGWHALLEEFSIVVKKKFRNVQKEASKQSVLRIHEQMLLGAVRYYNDQISGKTNTIPEEWVNQYFQELKP